jgi:N-acetylmuramoyl-L-alanine amidase
MQPLARKIAVASLGIALASGARALEVRDVRVSGNARTTHVVLEMSGRARHQSVLLRNPDRLVLDLANVHWAAGSRPVSNAGAVTQTLVSHPKAKDLRLVLNLDQAVRLKRSRLEGSARSGYRWVLDLVDVPGASRTASALAAMTTDASPLRSTPIKPTHAPRDERDLIIAIDAGHGGVDPGAIGKNGLREKDVTLAIARELAARVNAEPGLHAVLTRDTDTFVPLRDRMVRARSRQADLFVSVHADAVHDRSIDGSSVYILSPHGASNEASRWLADRENAADLIGGVSLDDKSDVLASVLLDLSQSASLNASQEAAERVLVQLTHAGEVHRRQVQQAGFMVLKSPDIPSMLVETAYISNPQEEARLRTREQQARIAAAIHRGVHDYFYANPPLGTRVATLAAGPAAAAGARPALATAAVSGGAGN